LTLADKTYLAWPFFDGSHRKLVADLEAWCSANHGLFEESHHLPVDEACRKIVSTLGKAGWLRYVVPKAYGGLHERLDVRSLCLVRETLAQRSGLVEFCFALQGLGVGPVTLFGSDDLKRRVLPDIAAGKTIGAFAISEKDAGSDLNAMQTRARREGDDYVIDGEKTWISNAGIADHYVVFCRMSDEKQRRFIALLVDAGNPGLSIPQRIEVMAPHPLGTVRLKDCRVHSSCVVGDVGKGMNAALGTLDIFRATVGAAALGFSRRALDEALAHTTHRTAFGQPLSAFQITQVKVAEMATAIDAGALLVYRAAWMKDQGEKRISREAGMAKLYATESAQWIVDNAVQLLGGKGVVTGATVERLYREVRALRIYEGASEIQKLIIAGQVFEAVQKNI
jgi:acyl-CoA dehydrogenase